MHRAACLLIASLVGCDTVWGLERADAPPSKEDEDGDGIVNSLDRCPHLPDQSQTDADVDGIPEDCDADDAEDQTVAVFFGFDGEVPAQLEIQGSAVTDVPGTITFGSVDDGLNTIVLKGVTAKTMMIDIGFEILADTIEPGPSTAGYDEIGLYGANRDFLKALRGNVCFYGVQKGAGPIYTELVEDGGSSQQKPTPGALLGTTGHMRLRRSPMQYDCSVFRVGLGLMSDSRDVESLEAIPGRIGLSTERVRTRLRYIYIAYQPLTRL